MTEHSFVRAVHRQLPLGIKIWKIIDDFHNGVSDALYFGTEGRLLFVEYKFVKELPVRDTTGVAKTQLPPLQREWMRDLVTRKVPAVVIVGSQSPKGGVWISDPKEVSRGLKKSEFLDRLESVKELATHIGTHVLGDS